MSNYFENSEEKRINCEGGFGIIPFYLSRDKSIPDGAKLLFSDMWLAQLQTGYCSLSNSELAEIRNVSVRTITNWLSLLKEKSWIKTQYILTQQGEIKQRNIYLNPKPEINNIQEKISEADFYTPRNQFLYPLETSFQVYNIREEISNKILKNTKKEQPIENNIPASGSPSSPDVDELRFAEEIFYNRFWVLVPNKVNIAKAKNRFFQITNKCKNEKKVNEVIEGYKRYLSYIENEHKKNKFQRRYQDPSTFLNVKEEKWLDPWEFTEIQQDPSLNDNSKRVKQPENWKDRIGIAKNLGLLDDFGREEINDMYNQEWKFIPFEAKQAIASEKVDVEYKERIERKRKRLSEIKEKTLQKREKEIELRKQGEKLKQIELEIKKPFLRWIEETFDLSSLIKDFKEHTFLKIAVPENISEFSMLKFYEDELWMSSEIDKLLEENLGDDKAFVEKLHECENELRKHDDEFKKHRELGKEIEQLDKEITNLTIQF
ncbi:MAG: helix-turn-helix domain-containing protein [Bacteroidales bacterium]|nr:helix-turn-helix domain-containing protein [Bacteroidales bacterium]MBO5853652.1 helix-turn-helix domain-containing protein [Bacteroidales bacterium]